MSGREYPDRPVVGIGVILLRPGEVLLIRRGRPPGEGTWSIPAGTQILGESMEDCARRELVEETGLSAGRLRYCYHTDIVHQDAEGRVRFHYAIVDFCAAWAGGDPRAGDDAAAVAWARLDALDGYGLTPALHEAIAAARQVLGIS